MSFKLIKSNKEEAIFTIEIDAETIEAAIMEEFIKEDKGKENKTGAPLSNRSMLGQHPELNRIASQGLNKVLPKYYMKAIKELDLTPMTYPEIIPKETKLGEPCLVKIRVALEPEIKLKQYEGLKATYSPVVVTDDDVKHQIMGMREQRGAGDDDEKLLASLPFDTIEAFAAEVRTSLQSLADEKNETNKRTAVMKQLIERNPCPLREEVVEQQIMIMINQFRQQVGANNFDNYLKSSGKTIEQAKKEVRPEAVESVRKNLLLGAVVAKIKPDVTEEDIKQTLMKQEGSVMEVGMTYEDRRKRVDETPGALEQLQHAIGLEKALDYVMSKAQLAKGKPVRILDQLPEHLK